MITVSDDELIANPYRQAVQRQRELAAPHADTLRDALEKAVSAMDDGAWVSSQADTFYEELTAHVRTLETAAERALDEFDNALDRLPVEVSPDSAYVHWHKYH